MALTQEKIAGQPPMRLAIVGPCASGKSSLAAALAAAGYEVRQPAQEHSYVPNMWQRLTNPDVLIYLDVDQANILKRRPYTDAQPQRLAEQHQRLTHAYQHCDLYLDTSALTPAQVQGEVLRFLQQVTGGEAD